MTAPPEFVAIDHPRFRRAQRAIFTERVVADCMTHSCRMVARPDRIKLDACCQYGVDADTAERDAILARAGEIGALLRADAARVPWFTDSEQIDADFPSGRYVRTTTHDGGCVFLAHDRRGCAIHRAAVEGGWRFEGVKPHVCRLFPLSYESDAIVLSDDFADYSCARVASAPTVYQVGRDALADIFGGPLVDALDAAEAAVLGPRRLRLVAG